MKCVPVHHGIPAVLHRDEPWQHRHSENGALQGEPEKVILFDFFLCFFYLVRKRYYFDFLLLSVAEQAGLRFTGSKFQNFNFLSLSITDLGPELQCLLRVKEDLS